MIRFSMDDKLDHSLVGQLVIVRLLNSETIVGKLKKMGSFNSPLPSVVDGKEIQMKNVWKIIKY